MIGKLLYNVGKSLYGIFAPVHDALVSPEMPPVLTQEMQEQAYDGVATVTGNFKQTVQYYIGGTFVLTVLLTVVLCRFFPKLGKKVAGKKAPMRRRRRRTTTRRRTYRRKK